jgi:ribokinase
VTIWNFGSINADTFYRVPHILAAGETLAAREVFTGLGGKGANQSAAAAKAGGEVHHLGAVGRDGLWARDRLREFGVHTGRIRIVDEPTGHAIVMTADDGENAIVIYPGANATGSGAWLQDALGDARPGDLLLMQNETALQPQAARLGAAKGLRVIYSAAPFDAAAVAAVLEHLSLLLLNAVEARQLADSMNCALTDLSVPEIVVTRGAEGARWIGAGGRTLDIPAPRVEAADTSGAGDTFAGYLAASLDAAMPVEAALERAVWASALKVQRPGTADAIPTLDEVLAFSRRDSK